MQGVLVATIKQSMQRPESVADLAVAIVGIAILGQNAGTKFR
jgi:hypothetical protein